MSKYTEAYEKPLFGYSTDDETFISIDAGWLDTVDEALLIADRVEQADAISNEEIQIKACRRYGCWEGECPHRARDRFCSDLAEIFFDGYNQALVDVRGDKE